MENWGLDDKKLLEIRPELIVIYASAFGRGAPYSKLGGYDPIAQGFSGLIHITVKPRGRRCARGVLFPFCDFMTGMAGALGGVLSLYARESSPDRKGQIVDVALYDMAFRMLGPLLGYYDLTGHVWRRDGNHSLGGAPTGHFQTSDGQWICTSIQSDDQFARLAHLIGQPEWLEDRRFANLNARSCNREAIESVVSV